MSFADDIWRVHAFDDAVAAFTASWGLQADPYVLATVQVDTQRLFFDDFADSRAHRILKRWTLERSPL
jgi:hypothetical protein